MDLNRISPSFDRAVAADDAITSSQISRSHSESVRKFGPLVLAALLLCALPAATFAQHRGYRGGYGGYGDELSALTCGSGSLTGAGTDACTVTLTEAAGSGGFAVTLASNSSAVAVPASVTVPAGATTAGFTATASAVTSAQTATLTASDRRNSEAFALQLNPSTTGTAALTLGSTSVAFGNVTLNTPSTQSVLLTSSGSAPLTISSAAITGTGFTMAGLTTPLTLAAGQSATLNVQFDPTAAGAETGMVTIGSNASAGGAATISLSGTGASATNGYQVSLSWEAPASGSDPVAGYKVYRATGTSGSYQLLNSSATTATDYTDSTVSSGTTYSYEIMSVDASGVQSSPSNVYTATIP